MARQSRRPLVTRICETCGAEFLASQAAIERGRAARYCSKAHEAIGRRRPVEDRFWNLVQKTADCWLWKGFLMPEGYGQLNAGTLGTLMTHRYSWLLRYGEIPDGQCVLHHCDVRACVRPDHLFLGDRKDNWDDCTSKHRHMHGEGHYRAKLTEIQVREIRRRHAAGETNRALAADFSVSHAVVDSIVLYKTWKHVK